VNNNNRKFINLFPLILAVLMLFAFYFINNQPQKEEVTSSKLYEIIETKQVDSFTISLTSVVIDISGTYKENGKDVTFTAQLPNTEQSLNTLVAALDENDVLFTTVDTYQTTSLMDILLSYVPWIAMAALMYFFFIRPMTNQARGMEVANASRARLEGNVKTRFSDVAGADEEKEEMMELIDYLRNPKRFQKMGARIPRGIIMVGPPGTGKTLLAKACAGEADVPFYSIAGSDFLEIYVGVGAKRVRDMFRKAKQTAPCIIFIDEIDAVGRVRGAGLGGGHDEREQTLNQLLVEMDGMNDNSGILMIAATNRPDVLDPALLRPGRFDRQITVSLPDVKGREEILKVHSRKKTLGPDVDLLQIARRTPGFSGADLENVLNEAAILTVRQNKTAIDMEIIDEAIDRVMMGPAKKSKTFTPDEKKRVAIHEAGHAIVGIYGKDSSTVVRKITIIPRGMAGGYNMITPKEEKYLRTKKELLSSISSFMGGRVAEEIYLNDISTGAVSDIQEATKIARSMVVEYGMSDLGPIQYAHPNAAVFLGRDYTSQTNYSEEVAFKIDEAIRAIIDQCYGEAKQTIMKHKKELDKIVGELMDKETITAEEIESLLGIAPTAAVPAAA